MNPTPLAGNGIGWAVEMMRHGHKVTRLRWNGKGQSLFLVQPSNQLMTLPYICILTVDGDLVPWVASQTDLLSHDWELADE